MGVSKCSATSDHGSHSCLISFFFLIFSPCSLKKRENIIKQLWWRCAMPQESNFDLWYHACCQLSCLFIYPIRSIATKCCRLLVGLDLFNDDTRPSGHISRPCCRLWYHYMTSKYHVRSQQLEGLLHHARCEARRGVRHDWLGWREINRCFYTIAQGRLPPSGKWVPEPFAQVSLHDRELLHEG